MVSPYRFKSLVLSCLFVLFGFFHVSLLHAQDQSFKVQSEDVDAAFFQLFASTDKKEIKHLLSVINEHWSPSYIPPAIETASYARSEVVRKKTMRLLKKKTGQHSTEDANDWYFWLWNQPENISASYADFKANLYKYIDRRFEKYFLGRQNSSLIRLDEIRWGGVRQDGIPPLRSPQMIEAHKADYLDDDNIVFGIEINGDARAYPKRILAWHEMFTDTIGGESIAGVYCTLCGTVIPYKTKFKGVNYRLGTSGFLYRSNKLMYDQATQSLWSTSKGEPVLGPLVNKGIRLEHVGMVTTTWGEWRRRHPDTKVLSLATGHSRNYGEGVAYNNYFSTDRLMFNTPFEDKRLKNKREVLALRFVAAPDKQLAIDTKFLKKNPVFEQKIGQQRFVVFTDKTGANRVYDPKAYTFIAYDGDVTVTDDQGKRWVLGEEWLEASDGARLNRLPYRRAFWFGWQAAFPETKLIK